MIKHRALLQVGSLHTSPRQCLEEPLLIRTNQRVSLTLTEKDRLTALEQLLIQDAPSRQLLNRLLSWGLSLVSVSIILIAIVALSVYEDLAKQLLLHHRFAGNYADWLSVGMMVLVIAGIGLAPAIVSGESSQLKEVLKSWFFHDLRRTHRLGKVIRGWKKTLPLHLYNVDRLSEQHWFWRLLAPLFLSHFQCSVWHVRHDQVNALEQWLEKHGVEAIEREQHPSALVSSFFFDEQEQRLHNWMQALSLVEPVSKTYVTARLVRCVARQLLPEESASQTSVLIERMKTDFGLVHLDSQGRLLWRGRSGQAERAKNVLRAQLHEHREDILVLLESPVSLCCLHQLLAVNLTPQDQVCILERLLERIQVTQQYDLILLYWLPMIGPMFSSELEAETRFEVVSLYQRLPPRSLDILLHLFERNGQFTEAIKLATYLHPLNPVHYAIAISSLQERLGNFEDACSQLEEIILPPQVEPPQPVAVRLFQRRAWMVVSGRLEHKKEQGRDALSQLASLLFSHSAFNEPLWLWHYHNITANYAEWDGDYQSAIGEYRKCLRIPGLGDFEYGASFVNLAISQRLIFLGDLAQEAHLHQAIRNGALGIMLKRRVGDRDEMPVVLHNQALNILYGVLPINRLEDVLSLAQEGLTIVEAICSVKRRAILTAEILLASALSGQETPLWKEKMRETLPGAMDSEKEQILALHTLTLEQHGLGIL